jgi:uroporphyrin-III C-methyltransferase
MFDGLQRPRRGALRPQPVFAPGTVWLAGAGPGDPELLTRLAARAIAEADVILHDALVGDGLLAEARADALVEYAGKRAGGRSCHQQDICARMVAHARAGNRVLRLKGGDPFVFGRGGEEAEALAAAGVPFRIVPGVTAGIGGLAYAGIPVTHRACGSAVAFVTGCGPHVAATITPQHLHINRNAMLVGGIQPHNYCLPVAKRETHRIALRAAATSGSPKFFLGTDSAPHFRHDKESACGCAGIFGAPHALESYLAVFDEEDALGLFEGFASLHGPAFYKLPVNEETITFERAQVRVPEELALAGAAIVPFHGGQVLGWRVVS